MKQVTGTSIASTSYLVHQHLVRGDLESFWRFRCSASLVAMLKMAMRGTGSPEERGRAGLGTRTGLARQFDGTDTLVI
jgi:hypothetical protein